MSKSKKRAYKVSGNPQKRYKQSKLTKKNTMKLIGISAYYKDDKDNGVSVQFDKKMLGKQFDSFYQSAKELTEETLRAININEVTVQDIQSQLKSLIEDFNVLVFNSSVRPAKSLTNTRITNKVLQTMLLILTDIWALTKLGIIKNDNYNGMQFARMR